MEVLELPEPPLRIEGFDISNIQGTAPTASMVVTENAEPARAEYRRFKIKWNPESPNDFAMMNEAVTRRLKNFIEGDEKFNRSPDLIMIDGGKGQLSAALAARDALRLTTPMVGLAKRHELLYVPVDFVERDGDREYVYREIELPLTAPGLLLLRKLRDEAHRFALSYHRKLRDKRLGASELEEIPGIGPRRRRLLLRSFGSLEAIRRATVQEIAAVPTMTQAMAQRVRDALAEA
jgi:excinuclease ABC subunit C